MLTDVQFNAWNERGLFTNKLLKKYLSTWKLQIIHQDYYAIITLLRGISNIAIKYGLSVQSFSEILDTRIPLIYFSDAGSGKGMGNDFYVDVFGRKGVGLSIKTLKEPSPERLVGSINTTIDQSNKKKGLSEADSKYMDPIIRGYLENNDDIIFEESEKLFNTKDGQDKLRIMRTAIDRFGSQTNLMSSETLKNTMDHEYYCKCNVAALTYHVHDVSKYILENGIFQRTIACFYHMTKAQVEDILDGKGRGSVIIFENGKEYLKKELSKVKDHIATLENKPIIIASEAENLIKNYLKTKLNEYYKSDFDVGELIKSFFPRYKTLLFKTAVSWALLKMKDKVEYEEAEEAIEVLSISFESMTTELIEHGIMANIHKEWYLDLRRALGKQWKKKGDIQDIMANFWGVSTITAWKRLKKLEVLFEFREGKGNSQWAKLK